MKNLVAREMPQAVQPWMRFQVGVIENRPYCTPQYDPITNRFLGMKVGPREFAAYKLSGVGKTAQDAQRMARRSM